MSGFLPTQLFLYVANWVSDYFQKMNINLEGDFFENVPRKGFFSGSTCFMGLLLFRSLAWSFLGVF